MAAAAAAAGALDSGADDLISDMNFSLSMRGKSGASSGSGAELGVPPQAMASRFSTTALVPTAARTWRATVGMNGSSPVATMRTASRPFQRMRERASVAPSALIIFHGSRTTRY